jgi:hypothetical protein
MVSDPLGVPFEGGEYAPHGEYPEVVLFFDRDYTTSVSPPPAGHGLSVPIAWVRYLAHDDDANHVDVWATGNQQLRHEAMIPGFREALDCWEALAGHSAFDIYERVFGDERKPQRRDGLRLIADLYRESVNSLPDPVPEGHSPPTIFVVDDVDLTDLADEEVEYVHPDIFTSLIETDNGSIDLTEGTTLSLPLDRLPDGFRKGDSPPGDSAAYSDAALSLSNDSPDASTTGLVATHFDPTNGSQSLSKENDSVTQ